MSCQLVFSPHTAQSRIFYRCSVAPYSWPIQPQGHPRDPYTPFTRLHDCGVHLVRLLTLVSRWYGHGRYLMFLVAISVEVKVSLSAIPTRFVIIVREMREPAWVYKVLLDRWLLSSERFYIRCLLLVIHLLYLVLSRIKSKFYILSRSRSTTSVSLTFSEQYSLISFRSGVTHS